MARQPPSGPRPPHYRGLAITLRHSTLDSTLPNEWSARRRDLYLTTHNAHTRQTSMTPARFEPTIPASEKPQSHDSDRAATGIGGKESMANFFVIKPTRCTNFTNLFCHETLHVSGSSSAHHQEFTHCTLGNDICHTGLKTAFEQDQDQSWSCSKAVYYLVWHVPLLSVQWINFWWWTEELSETCRVSWQNKCVKLVHLVGFITKKFVTMHGHMNVKKKERKKKESMASLICISIVRTMQHTVIYQRCSDSKGVPVLTNHTMTVYVKIDTWLLAFLTPALRTRQWTIRLTPRPLYRQRTNR